MRFGCCTNMNATGPDKTGIEAVEKLAQYGYDYIELPLAEMMDLSQEEFDILKARVDDSGIKCEVCNNFFPAKVRLTGPNVDNEQVETYYRAALKRAHSLGVKTVIFGSGGAKSYPEGYPYNEAFQQLVEVTKKIDPIAGEEGIIIAIEPIRTPECNIINTFAEGVKLAKEVNGKNTKVLIDFYHMVWEKESPKILLENREWLHHTHFSYPNIPSVEGRIFPTDINEWDYKEFIDILKEIGYEGTMSIEATTLNFEDQAQKTIKFLKEYF